MLTSSRALVHAPWRPVVGRIVRRNAAKPQQTLKFGTTVARPCPAIALDPSDERTLPKPTGKNLFRNYTTSAQSLQLLVEESKFDEASTMLLELRKRGVKIQAHPVYEKVVGDLLSQELLGTQDRELLVYWLELLPDIQNAAPNALRGFVVELSRHARVDASIPMSVARALAHKGYKALVMKEIVPLMGKALDNASLDQELAKALADFDSRAGMSELAVDSQSEVFEDPSEDYASVMASSAPPPPSILEIIENTLPPILPTPDISDHSVFEDEVDEDYIVHQSSARHLPRQFPADQLSRLVKEQRHDDAFYLLKELNHLHIQIPPSFVYEAAALDALRRPISDHYTLEDQLNRFAAWFSLIPPSHETQGRSDIGAIQRLITQASLINVELVMRFTMILAQKGYMSIQTQALPVIMRFSSSDTIRQYIQELEAGNLTYWTTRQPENAALLSSRFSGKLRSAAIRLLAYSGRVEDAVALLPDPKSQVRLTAYTYDKLLRTIRDSNNPSHAEYLPRIESLREGAAILDGPATSKFDHIFTKEEDREVTAGLDTDGAHVQAGSLPETLRYLKHALRRAENNPHPFVIAEFLDRYLATGRLRAPSLLLNIALNSSFHSTSIFLFAEMLYYRRLGHHHLIIQVFVDHFYLSGVPRDDVLRLYNESHRLSTLHTGDNHASELGNEDPFTRICKFSPDRLPRGKTWPMKLHCNLVWHALVALTPTHLELQHLYTKLLSLARGQDDLRSVHPHMTSIQPLLPPPSWRQLVDCAAFTPFMRGLMRVSGPERGTQIISDMLNLGIEPSVYHFTELAGNFARRKEMSRALMILDQLEASSGLRERLRQQQRNRRERRVSSRSSPSSTPPTPPASPPHELESFNSDFGLEQTNNIPEPDLVMYISLMRGFLISQSIDGFEAVHKRLLVIRDLLPRKRFKKDQQAMLDEVYAEFRMLCRRQKYNWQQERKAGFKAWLETERKGKERAWDI